MGGINETGIGELTIAVLRWLTTVLVSLVIPMLASASISAKLSSVPVRLKF
jgi:hypothetical protein